MEHELCPCGKYKGKLTKLNRHEYCYDRKYGLPKLIEGPERIGPNWVKKRTSLQIDNKQEHKNEN